MSLTIGVGIEVGGSSHPVTELGTGFGAGVAVILTPDTLFQIGQRAGFAAMLSVAGRTVLYRRVASDVSLKAVPARTSHPVNYDDTFVTQQHTKDWLTWTNSLSSFVLPERYDQVIDGSCTYEVLSAGGEAQFEFMDHERQMIRIHTRQL